VRCYCGAVATEIIGPSRLCVKHRAKLQELFDRFDVESEQEIERKLAAVDYVKRQRRAFSSLRERAS